MAGTLGAASIPLFACMCLLVVMTLQVVSFAAPHWASDARQDFGLWKYDKCIEVSQPTSGLKKTGCRVYVKGWEVDDWLAAVRGLECIAIVFWSLPLVIVPVYLYVALGLYYKCMMGCMTAFTLIGAICNIVGVIIFGLKLEDNDEWDLEWCLVVAGLAGALGFVAFVIFLVSTCYRPVFASQTHLMSGFYVDPDRNRVYVVENIDTKPGPLEGGHVNPAMDD